MKRFLVILLFTACASTNHVVSVPLPITYPPPVVIPPVPVQPPVVIAKPVYITDSFPVRIDHATYDRYMDIALQLMFKSWDTTKTDDSFNTAWTVYNFAKEHLVGQTNDISTTIYEDSSSTRVEMIHKGKVYWITAADSSDGLQIKAVSNTLLYMQDSVTRIYQVPVPDILIVYKDTCFIQIDSSVARLRTRGK